MFLYPVDDSGTTLAIPQVSHAWLAWQAAAHWGNRAIARPAPRPEVLAAVKDRSDAELIDDALVVDIGGTTTDFALVEKGQVAVSEEGATVSDFKTAVQAANLYSIALGGDSHISLGRDSKVGIGPERVVPAQCSPTGQAMSCTGSRLKSGGQPN